MRNFNQGRRSSRDRGPRQMFKAVCDECGKECELPFKPTSSKPVYCSNCFDKVGGGSERRNDRGGNRSFGDRNRRNDRGPREMFKAVCDECGKECELPFKPSSNKPVYCDNCFGKNKDKNQNDLSDQIKAINEKLDKIMNVLTSKEVKNTLAEKKEETKKTSSKKTAVKKTEVKKETTKKPTKKTATKKVEKKPAAKKKTVAKKTVKTAAKKKK